MPGFGWRSLGALHEKAVTTPAKITASANKYTAGIYRTAYSGWPSQNTASPTFFATGTVTGHSVVNNFDVSLTAAQVNIAYQWLGYIKPNYSGNWSIYASPDDTVTVWIGSNAVSGFTTGNAVLNLSDTGGSSGNINLNAGTYYPIRVQYANNQGPGSLSILYTNSHATNSDTWTNLLYYNPATNGF